MTRYSDSTIVDVDATVVGPISLVDMPGLPEPDKEPVSETAQLDPGISHTLLRAVGISTLTGASLTLMTKPVFWMDAKYLYNPPINKQPVSERFSSIDVADVRFEPETIVVPAVATPKFSQVPNPVIGGSEELATLPAPETTPLSRPQGFRSPTPVKPGAINLPPATAAVPSLALEQSAVEQTAAGSTEEPQPSPINPPQLDLSAVLPTPPTVAYQSSEDAIAARPNNDLATSSVESLEPLPTETFSAILPPATQINGADTTQSPDPTLPWMANNSEVSTADGSVPVTNPANTLAQPPAESQLPPVAPPLPFTENTLSAPVSSEPESPPLSLPEPRLEIAPTVPAPPTLPNISVPRESELANRESDATLSSVPPSVEQASEISPGPEVSPPLPLPSTVTVPENIDIAVPEISTVPETPSIENDPDSLIIFTAEGDSETIDGEPDVSERPALPWLNPLGETSPANDLTNAPNNSNNQVIVPPPTTNREPVPDTSSDTQESPERLPSPLVQPQPIPSELEIAATSPEKIPVSQFSITGNTVFDAELLESVAWSAITPANEAETAAAETVPNVTRPSEPMMLSRADLVRASDAVTQYYIQQQYINSGAYVPEQNDWPDGAVEIRVIEGSLEAIDVTVEGPGLFSLGEHYIRDRLELATGDVLNLDELVDGVRLLEQDPLIEKITTTIEPGTETGTSFLDVQVTQDDGLDVNLFTSNDNSPSIGEFGQGASISQANLLGRGDRLSIEYERTEGSDSWDFGYSVPLNARNGTLSLDFNTTDSRVIEEPFDLLDIESESQTYELSFRQPLILTPTEELALSLTGYHRDSEGAFLEGLLGEAQPFPARGADDEGRTSISAIRFGQEWIKRQPKQVISLFSEFSLGLDALGSTINSEGPDSRFFLWRGQGQWARSLGPDSLFLLRGNVQFADSPLVPSEQFGVGGATTVRGYRPNSILTDNGWLLSSEVRLPVLRIPEVDGVLQVAPFVDVGGGWNNGSFVDPDPDTLASTGLGLIWNMGDDFDARLDWGIPLTSGGGIEESGLLFRVNFSPF